MCFLATTASRMTIGNAYLEHNGTEKTVEAVANMDRRIFIVAFHSVEVLTALVGARLQIKLCNNGRVQAQMTLLSVP